MAWTKNVAVSGLPFGLVNKSNGDPITSGTVYGYIVKDGGSQSALTNTPTHMGNGLWVVNLTANEMNADMVGLTFLTDSSVPVYYSFKTESNGNNLVSITVNDGSIVIPNVDVYIYNSTNSVFLTNGRTNTSGIYQTYLSDGTYNVRLNKVGVTFNLLNSIVVNADTTEFTLSGINITIGIPSSAQYCRIYDYCYDQKGTTPLESVTATATITSIPYNFETKLHDIEKITGIYNSDTGLVYWDVVYGAEVQFIVKEVGIKKRVIIPNVASARLSDV